MKRIIKKTIILVTSLVLAASTFTNAVIAAGNVTYEGEKTGFVFTPGSSNSKSDLLENFKNIMPGDEISDSIEIKSNYDSKIRIYMKALGAEAGSKEFLNQLNMTITNEKGEEIFNSKAGNSGQLTDWVLLGEFEKGDSQKLEIKLEVPIELGDDFQDKIGYLSWVFKSEDLNRPTPQTGDTSDPTKYILLLTASTSMALMIIYYDYKKRKLEQY